MVGNYTVEKFKPSVCHAAAAPPLLSPAIKTKPEKTPGPRQIGFEKGEKICLFLSVSPVTDLRSAPLCAQSAAVK